MIPTLVLALLTQPHAASPADQGRLLTEVNQLAAASTNEARFEALTSLLRARGLTFAVQPFTIEKPVGREPRTEGRNVVVTLGDGAGHILVGAHYDAARLPDGSLSDGAIDNAASSVMLVRLAEWLRAGRPRARVKLVWFDMEELGLIGSNRYIKANGSGNVRAMLNFDVNAYGDTILFGPSSRDANAALRRAMLDVCAAEARDCVGFPQMPPSDDRSFVSAGIAALSIAVLPAREVHQLWLLMNVKQDSGLADGHLPAVLRTIHTNEDTVAKVEPESISRMLRFAYALVHRFAGASREKQ